MKRTVKMLAPLAVAGLSLTGCGETGPDFIPSQPSRIVDTWYDDEDVVNVPVCMIHDKNGICTFSTNIPIVDEESWNIRARQCNGGAGPQQGDEPCVEKEFEVSEELYSTFYVGEVIVVQVGEIVRVPQ